MMHRPILRFVKDHPDARIPVRATSGSAGADLHAVMPNYKEVITLYPGSRLLVSTGLKVAIPEGYEIQIRPRSGLALKYGITVLNSPGTIDSDYRGVMGVVLIHHGHEPFEIRTGDRIAQMVVAAVAPYVAQEVETLEETERAGGGFGSTGVRA